MTRVAFHFWSAILKLASFDVNSYPNSKIVSYAHI